MKPIIAQESIAAAEHLPGTLTRCSDKRGWHSLLLRRYDEPLEADFETRPTVDQLIVLVRRGACTIESRAAGGWRSAQYRAGDLGMIPPGEASRLRFHGPVAHQTLHLHIPALLLTQAEELVGKPLPRLDELQARHGMAAAIIGQLERALEAGAPAIYAESAIHYLLLQMLLEAKPAAQAGRRDRRSGKGERLDAYMHANLSRPVTLADMASEVDLSVFQLIRFSRGLWGSTPAARLTKLRLEQAVHLLETTDQPITAVAMDCGYENPSHFATAFRRRYGLAPLQFRKLYAH